MPRNQQISTNTIFISQHINYLYINTCENIRKGDKRTLFSCPKQNEIKSSVHIQYLHDQ